MTLDPIDELALPYFRRLMDPELRDFYEWKLRRHRAGDENATRTLLELHKFLLEEGTPEPQPIPLPVVFAAERRRAPRRRN